MSGVMTLEKAKSVARKLGVRMVTAGQGGEILFEYDGMRCRVNNRRKDASRELLKFLRRVEERQP